MMETLFRSKYLVFAFLIFSCVSSTQRKESSGRINNQRIISEINLEQKDSIIMNGYDFSFIYEDNTVKESLSVSYKSDSEIIFSLNLRKKDGTCSVVLNGKATNKNENLDPELDEDEEGLAYPSNEYVYENGECTAALRIAMTAKDKAIVKILGCKETCYPETSNLLRLLK